MMLADGILSGRNGTLFVMVITTILLFSFCMMALRLRKYIIGTIGEASSKVISKFVIPPDMGGSSASVMSSGGGSGGGSGGSGAGLVSGVTSIAGGMSDAGGSGIGGKVMGAAGLAGAAGLFGTMASKSEGHQAVGTGDGSDTIGQNNSVANDNSTQGSVSNASSSDSSSQSDVAGDTKESAGGIASANNLNNVMTGPGVATSGDYMDGSMRADSYQDVSDKEKGAQLMSADSLASVSSNPNVTAKAGDMTGESGTAADRMVGAGDAYVGDVSAYGSGSSSEAAMTNTQNMDANELHADRLVAGSMSADGQSGNAYAEGGEAGVNGSNGLRGVSADGSNGLVEGAANNGIHENGPGYPYHGYESEYERGAQAGEVNASVEAQSDASMSGYATSYVNGASGSKSLGQTARDVQAGSVYSGQGAYAYGADGVNGSNGMITSGVDVNTRANGSMYGKVSSDAAMNGGLRGVSVPLGGGVPGAYASSDSQSMSKDSTSSSGSGRLGVNGQNGQNGRAGESMSNTNGLRGVSLGQAAMHTNAGVSGSDANAMANATGVLDRGSGGMRGVSSGQSADSMYRNPSSSMSQNTRQNQVGVVPGSSGMIAGSPAGRSGMAGSVTGSYRSMADAAAGVSGDRGQSGAVGRNGMAGSAVANAERSGHNNGTMGMVPGTAGNASANVRTSVTGGRGGSGFGVGSSNPTAMSGRLGAAPSVVGSYAQRSGSGSVRGERQGMRSDKDREKERRSGMSGVVTGSVPESRGNATHTIGGSDKVSLGAAARAARGGEFGSDRMRQSGAYRRQSQGSETGV